MNLEELRLLMLTSGKLKKGTMKWKVLNGLTDEELAKAWVMGTNLLIPWTMIRQLGDTQDPTEQEVRKLDMSYDMEKNVEAVAIAAMFLAVIPDLEAETERFMERTSPFETKGEKFQ